MSTSRLMQGRTSLLRVLVIAGLFLIVDAARAEISCPSNEACTSPIPPLWRNTPNNLPPRVGDEHGGFSAPEGFCQWYKTNRASPGDAALEWIYVPQYSGQYPGTSYGTCNCVGGNCIVGVEHELECPLGFGSANIANSYGFDPPTFLGLDAPSDPAYCRRAASAQDPAKNLGDACKIDCAKVANPINAGTGNKFQEEVDYVGAGPLPLTLKRYYNSLRPRAGSFGPRWRGWYDRVILWFPAGSSFETAHVVRADGRVIRFNGFGATWTGDPDIADRLERLTDGGGAFAGWRLVTAGADEIEEYDVGGKLISITNRAGLAQTLAYDGQGRVATVTGPFGRSLTFAYGPNGNVSSVTRPDGAAYTYTYAANEALATVSYPGGDARTYHYENASYPYALTGITDENGQRFSTYGYDGSGRATLSEHAGGANRVTVAYGATNTVTDALGAARSYSFTALHGMARRTATAGPACPACGPATQTFDANGNIASRTDWNGNLTTYQYDLGRNLETSRTEASGRPEARTITTAWHPTFRLPVTITEPGRETTMSYDSSGNLLSRSVRDTATNEIRTWTYTYNANGQVLTMDGPRTDVADLTTYTYYANNDADLGKRGNLATVTNATGHLTCH